MTSRPASQPAVCASRWLSEKLPVGGYKPLSNARLVPLRDRGSPAGVPRGPERTRGAAVAPDRSTGLRPSSEVRWHEDVYDLLGPAHLCRSRSRALGHSKTRYLEQTALLIINVGGSDIDHDLSPSEIFHSLASASTSSRRNINLPALGHVGCAPQWTLGRPPKLMAGEARDENLSWPPVSCPTHRLFQGSNPVAEAWGCLFVPAARCRLSPWKLIPAPHHGYL